MVQPTATSKMAGIKRPQENDTPSSESSKNIEKYMKTKLRKSGFYQWLIRLSTEILTKIVD